jgi:2-dehydro-3-deoxyphosphogluconate aldolase/(4S)-4-hydroxy-2-oxoglutarate aldolase
LGEVSIDMPTGAAVAPHNNADVLATIEREGVVPVFNDADVDIAKQVARCIVAGGLSTFEFTNRGEGALDVFAEFVTWAGAELPELIVGVGTIVEPVAAERAMELGARFVFAPSLSGSVAVVCNSRKIPYVPGCGTVTEIQTAYELGCEMVKLFPAESLGGPAFLKAVRAPCPWVRAIPTGGVEPTVASMKPWFDAGALAVGMGSKLLPTELIAAADWDAVEQRVAQAVTAVSGARA